MIEENNKNIKAICLISRSIYPHPISKHSQNMQTFQGWLRFWGDIVIVSQNNSKATQTSQYKNIYGVLIPFISNKYLNVIYFTFTGIFNYVYETFHLIMSMLPCNFFIRFFYFIPKKHGYFDAITNP